LVQLLVVPGKFHGCKDWASRPNPETSEPSSHFLIWGPLIKRGL
jgi:hypothetical protein